MKRLFLPLSLCAVLLGFPACATAPSNPSKSPPFTVTEDNNVVFQNGKEPIVARRASLYKNYRPVPAAKYTQYHLPADAKFAVAGSRYADRDVLYALDAGGYWKIYGFTFGKFDIDWPPQLLGVVAKPE